MAIQNGIIVAPVTMDDVRKVLGDDSETLQGLIESGKINPWARCKPVQWYSLDTPRFDPLWIRGADGRCGLGTPTLFSSMERWKDTKLYSAIYPDPSWRYLPPASNFRLTDFEGYDHNARAPFGHVNNLTLRLGKKGRITVPIEAPAVFENKTYIELSDITGASGETFGDWYFGLMAYINYECVYATADAPGCPGQIDLELGKDIEPGGITLYPFLSNRPVQRGGVAPSDLKIVSTGQKSAFMILTAYQVFLMEITEARYVDIPSMENGCVQFRIRITNQSDVSSTPEAYLYYSFLEQTDVYDNGTMHRIPRVPPGGVLEYPEDGSYITGYHSKDEGPFSMMKVSLGRQWGSEWTPIENNIVWEGRIEVSFYANRISSDKTQANWSAYISNTGGYTGYVSNLTIYRKDVATDTVTAIRRLGDYEIAPNGSIYPTGTVTGLPKASQYLGITFDETDRYWWASIGEGDKDPGGTTPVTSVSLTLSNINRLASDNTKAEWTLTIRNTGETAVTVSNITMTNNGVSLGAITTDVTNLQPGASVTRTGTANIGTSAALLQVSSSHGVSNSVSIEAVSGGGTIVTPENKVTVTLTCGRKDNGFSEAGYTVTITNSGSASATLTGMMIKSKVGTTESTAATIGSVTVAAGATVTKQGTVSVTKAQTWLAVVYDGLSAANWISIGEVTFDIFLECTRHYWESTVAEYALSVVNNGSASLSLPGLKLVRKTASGQADLVSFGDVTLGTDELSCRFQRSESVTVPKEQTWLAVSYTGIPSLEWKDLGVGVDRKKYVVFVWARWTDRNFNTIECEVEVTNNTSTTLNLSGGSLYLATNSSGTNMTSALASVPALSVPGNSTAKTSSFRVSASSSIQFVCFTWAGNPESREWCPIEMPPQTETD